MNPSQYEFYAYQFDLDASLVKPPHWCECTLLLSRLILASKLFSSDIASERNVKIISVRVVSKRFSLLSNFVEVTVAIQGIR